MRRSILAAAAALLAALPAVAQAPPSEPPGKSAEPLALQPSVVYDGEGVVNARGGDRTGTVYVGTLRLMLTVDLQRLLGWSGATLFFDALGTHGGHPSRLAGDAQGVSNLEAPGGGQLYEAWLQQNLFANRLSLLVGRFDLNAEFYRLQSAALFVNSSFGVGPELSQSGPGGAGPSIFPNTSVGVRIGFRPARDVVLRLAVLDGVPVDRADGGHRVFARGDGLLLVGEAAWLTRPTPAASEHPLSTRLRIGRSSGLAPYDGKLAVGGWYYTAAFDDLSDRDADGRPVRRRESAGAYVLADELVYHEGGASAPGRQVRQIHAFLELGFGDARVDRFGWYAGAGVVFSGLLPSMQNDELGAAVAVARNGSHYLDLQSRDGLPVTGTETTVELTYLFQATSHLALQPDVQYVMRPGTDPTKGNALVFGLRFEISY